MPDYIFDTSKCSVPPLTKLPRDRLITDCRIPPAPSPIRECADLSPEFSISPDLPFAPPLPPNPPNPPNGESCQLVWTGAECIGTADFNELVGHVPVYRLLFRKDSSFRVYSKPSVDCPDKHELLVDIGGGPTDSVFWQGPGGQAPKWTTCPQIGHSIKVGTTVQPGWWFSVSPGGTLFGIAAGAQTNQLWRAPNANAERDRCYLYADSVNGNCHQLAWSYPGIDGEFSTYTGKTITVKKGLITAITGFDLPASNSNVDCDVTDCLPFNPCD